MLDDSLPLDGFRVDFLSSRRLFEVAKAKQFLKKRGQCKPLTVKNQFTKG